MIKTLTIIALLFSSLVYAQVTSKAVYKNIEGLTIADSVTWKDISGDFYRTDGFGGYNFQLDSNMTFRKVDFSCLATFKVDSGSWKIKNNNTLVLQSKETTLYFDIVKFGSFYFFILPKQRRQFISDLRLASNQFKDIRPFYHENTVYTKEYLVRFTLMKKYYVREVEDLTDIVKQTNATAPVNE